MNFNNHNVSLTMTQAARQFGIKPEHNCFAARLGKLPAPVGRTADDMLLFDAGQLADRLGISLPGAKQ